MGMRKGTRRSTHPVVLAGLVMFPTIFPAQASAQVPPPRLDTIPGARPDLGQRHPIRPAPPFYRSAALVSLGSLAGSVSGALIGEGLGWDGGDSPGQNGAMALGLLGGAMGSAAGALLAYRGSGRLTIPEALAAGGLGLVGGALAGLVMNPSERGERSYPDYFVAFSIPQGVAAAAVAFMLGKDEGFTNRGPAGAIRH